MARIERSAGFVVFHRPAGPTSERRYLLLDSGRNWDFPKGHVNKNESDLDAAVRELREETGIADAQVVSGFSHEISYFFRQARHGLIRKTVVFFLAEAGTDSVAISREHVGHVYLPYEQALKQLKFAGARQVLRAAEERLAGGSQQVATDTLS